LRPAVAACRITGTLRNSWLALAPLWLLSAAAAASAPACAKKEPVGPTPTEADAASPVARDAGAVDAASEAAPPLRLGIGPEGGVVEQDGVKLVVPEGALKTVRELRIVRVSESALSDWPRGTIAGYTFEPAEEPFRLPVTIELPRAPDDGEVMCQVHGERLHETGPGSASGKPWRFHVGELPKRCAVYSSAHANARKAAGAREAAVVDKHNHAHRWEIKGKMCDPHELVRPNAGKDLREPPGAGGCPAGMAPIPGRPGACVDRWEAHLVEVLDDGTEHTWSPYFNPGALRVRAKSAPSAVPQGYVSQVQAVVACREAGKRLCKDEEWVAACRGRKSTRFPYGADERRGTCNDHRDKHPAMQYLEAHDLSVFTKLEHPCISQIPDSLLATGTKKECVTTEGAFDMVGNLHEWTADPKGHFRGGYYVDTWLNGHGCDYVTTAHEARYWDYSTGFRCCADAAR
jgi:Sulfatase-modifying factor enzyme 1